MSSSFTTHDREWDFLDGADRRTDDRTHGRTGERTDDSRPARARRTEEAPPFWRAPFSAHYYREVGYVLTGLPVGLVAFAVAVILFSFGAGTFVTALGLPVLAGLTVAARGFGRLERSRARGMLALDVPGPAAVRQTRPGTWGAITARLADAAGWKGVLYQVVMFPWAVFSFAMTLVFLLVGWTMALYPLYHWVFPTFTPWRGYRVFDYTDGKGVEHVYFIEGAGQIAAVSVAGIVIVFLTAQLVRSLTNVNRAAIQGLCGR